MGDVMTEQLKQFIQNNKDLINQNSKESWEEIYKSLRTREFKGEFTECILASGIEDPAQILGYMPDRYLRLSHIREYTIPEGLDYISTSAFARCNDLTEITIPEGVETIYDYAFYRCTNLKRVVIPDSVTSIETKAFAECTSLTDVTISANCKFLTYVWTFNGNRDTRAFSKCSNLTQITFKGTMRQALNIGVKKKRWREGSPIEKIICTDGVIEL